MNKTININLGGLPLIIDEDAFDYLQQYTNGLRRVFAASDGREEIIADIETRLAELISQKMGNRSIVSIREVEAAVTILGRPEQLDGDPTNDATPPPITGTTGSKSGSYDKNYQPGRRLFRDENDAVVAGVCSGLAQYFGFGDPIWMRLIFVLTPFFTFGTFAMLYLILWAILPKATSTADRLAMRGEPINVENIAKEVEDGFDRLSSRVANFGDEAKKKSDAFMGDAGVRNARGFVSEGISGVGSFIKLLFSGLGFVIKFFVWGLLAVVLLSLITAWIGLVTAVIWGKPLLGYVSAFSASWSYFALFLGFLVLAIPLFGLISMFSKRFFKTKTPAWLSPTLVTTWFVSAFGLMTFSVMTANKFRETGAITKNIDLSEIKNDTLRIEAITDPGIGQNYSFGKQNYEWDRQEFNDNIVKLYDDHVSVLVPIDFRIKKTTGANFEFQQTLKSQGSRVNEAQTVASQINYPIEIRNGKMILPNFINIQQGEKWRVQRVEMTLFVPVGKSIQFGKIANQFVNSAEYGFRTNGKHIGSSPDEVFKMAENGLVCAGCALEGEFSSDGFNDFSKINIDGNVDVEIIESDDYGLQLSDEKTMSKLVKFSQDGNRLTISSQVVAGAKPAHLTIKTNNLSTIFAENCGEIKIVGFDEDALEATFINIKSAKIMSDFRETRIKQLGKSEVVFIGDGDHLKVTLSDNAVFEGAGFSVNHANIKASSGSSAKVNADETFEVKKDETSSVKNIGKSEKTENQE
jgi:phage shock protein PspC (stress-responsive transcriptional regulator)